MSAVADLRLLLRTSGFRRLAYARVLSQGGDGMFQAGIAATFFFDPNESATPVDIALGFVVFFAPFTLVGPFVGPLVDRWQRQRIILVGNLIRVVLAAGIGAALVFDGPLWTLYAGALLTLSVNRFLLAAMTAGIPRVSPPEQLLTANATLPTLGTIAAIIGGGFGIFASVLAPRLSEDNIGLTTIVAAGMAFGLSSWAATRLTRGELGPVHPLASLAFAAQVRELWTELRDGAKYLHARRTPWHALGVMASQRLLYGTMLVSVMLVARNVLADPNDSDAGLAELGKWLLFAGIGFGLAAILTPALGHRIPRHSWIVMCLGIGAFGQSLLAFSSERWALYAAAIIVSFAVQGGKIAVDTIVQRDTDDQVRGRAFTLYDTAYNVAFISSALVIALLSTVGVLPESGYSAVVMASLAAVYGLLALVYSRAPVVPRKVSAHS